MNNLLSIIGVAALIAGCSLLSSDKTVVTSAAFPNTTIECRGEIVLPGGPCKEWGEKLLANSDVAQSTARLLLTVRGGNSRCDAEYFGADGRLLAHEATVCPRN
jgi:hypothetical protein